MLFTLLVFVLVQVLGAMASFEDVIFPRSPNSPLAFQDAAEINPRAVPQACSYALDALDYCASVSPGFLAMVPSRQAPCLCYSSTVWVPSIFDGAVSTCASYAKTADPVDYSAIADLQGFCSAVGNVAPANTIATTTRPAASSVAVVASSTPIAASSLRSAVASATPVVTPAPTAKPSSSTNPGCSTVFAAISYCSSVSPGFLDFPESKQAPCLCYSSASWDPGFFDNAVQTCANYAQTADTSDFTDIQALEDFCTSVGDVLHNSVAASQTGGSGGGVGVVLTGGSPQASAGVRFSLLQIPSFCSLQKSQTLQCL